MNVTEFVFPLADGHLTKEVDTALVPRKFERTEYHFGRDLVEFYNENDRLVRAVPALNPGPLKGFQKNGTRSE